MIFFRFSYNSGFRVFLVHPNVVSVLLSTLVERCFVSHMRDLKKNLININITVFRIYEPHKRVMNPGFIFYFIDFFREARVFFTVFRYTCFQCIKLVCNVLRIFSMYYNL